MGMRMRTAFFLAGLVGFLLFALGVLAFTDSYRRVARMTEIQQAASIITGSGRRLVLHTHDLILHRDIRHREQWQTLHDELTQHLAAQRSAFLSHNKEISNIQHYLGILEQQTADFLTYMALPETQAEGQGTKLRTVQINLRVAELESALDELEKAVRHSIEAELGTSGQGLLTKFTLLFALYVLASALAWWFFYLRMQRPLSTLESGIHRIRDGDFRFRPDKVASDEIGSVVDAFNEMLDQQQVLTGKLARSEAQLRATLDNAPNVAIQWYDEAGRVTYWNPASEKMFGWKAEEALGKTLDMLIHTPEEAAEFLQILEEIRESGAPYGPYEVQVHTRNGRTAWTLSSTFALPLDDEHVGFVCMDVDITQRKQAEQRVAERTRQLQESEFNLRLAQSVAHIGSWFLDLAGGELTWSEETYRIFGVSNGTPLSYEDFLGCIHPEDRDAVNTAWQAALRGAPYDISHRIVVDEQTKWVREQAQFTFGASGQVRTGVGTVQDITAQTLAELELKRSNAELEQFSYAISHDMRQPLRMISSYLQLLERSLAGQLDDDKREYFHFAIDGAKRLDRMLVGLLEYSRVGRKGEPPQWVESRALLDEALLFLQPAITETHAEVRITGEWPPVFASPDEMVRLMQNLIDNAVKYHIAGRTPQISVRSETVDDEWHLSISDNGAGIAPGQIHRLFQVFQRLQARAAYEGTGIGLALCRKIAEHHHGRIEAESAGEGQGSTFRVRLPLKRSEGAPAAGDEGNRT